MISVREEADGFRQIGECEKAKGAGRALRHLKQPKEGANNTDRQHNQAHQTSLGVAKQFCVEKDGDGGYKRYCAQPRPLRRDAYRHPWQIAAHEFQGLCDCLPVGESGPNGRR